ncbi:Sas10/Utp3/C1D family protein, partial [Kipferlia bialata]|eukprot:g5722.t1
MARTGQKKSRKPRKPVDSDDEAAPFMDPGMANDDDAWGTKADRYYVGEDSKKGKKGKKKRGPRGKEDPVEAVDEAELMAVNEQEAHAMHGVTEEDMGDELLAAMMGESVADVSAPALLSGADTAEVTMDEQEVVVEGRESLAGLSAAQVRDIINRDSPELVTLLTELRSTVAELRDCVKNTAATPKDTSKGLTLLDLQNQLYLNYLVNLSFYFHLKASGEFVPDHPVVDQLVDIRATIEHVKSLEAKLQSRVHSALLAAASQEGEAEEVDEEAQALKGQAADALFGDGMADDDSEEEVEAMPVSELGKTTEGEREREAAMQASGMLGDARVRSRLMDNPDFRAQMAEQLDLPDELEGGDDVEAQGFDDRLLALEMDTHSRVSQKKKQTDKKRNKVMAAAGVDDAFADIGDFGRILARGQDRASGNSSTRAKDAMQEMLGNLERRETDVVNGDQESGVIRYSKRPAKKVEEEVEEAPKAKRKAGGKTGKATATRQQMRE